ncbi:MAG TPA: hypothetical protein PKE21_13685 [Flavobacteriales bacterium]|nr:hypothetical protein [Flavobacteriales bacterium]HMR28528.1 hypothetical protein [Flavobacteriales bacterium]
MSDTKTINTWAIVELLGHNRIAGHITEQTVVGVPMLRVDVPAIGELPAFTRLFGGAAIYAINPCDQETALQWARACSTTSNPIISFEGRRLIDAMVTKHVAALNAGTTAAEQEEDDDLHGNDD